MESLKTFWRRIYEARFFWLLQAGIELKNKFRRSKLGLLWVCVSPLCLTIIMSFVFGTVFHQDIKTYAPYILSGLLCWDIFSVSWVAGSGTLIGSEPYIRQFNHPIVIYPLKSSLVCIISFSIAVTALALWIFFIEPLNVLLGYLFLLPALVIFFLFSWGSMIISSYTGAKYRDYPQMASLLLQTLWYLSPVFFQESMFESSEWLHQLFLFNPVTHMLSLIRQPFLYGSSPSAWNYLYSFGFVLLIDLCAVLINRKNERDIIFYL